MTITNLVPYPTPNMASFIAGEDLSSYQYKFVKFGATVNTVEHIDATTDIPCGILMNDPTSGGSAEVALIGGGAKLKCNSTVTNGAKIAMTSDGTGDLASATEPGFALALPMGSTTATNDVIPVIVLAPGGGSFVSAAVVTALGTTTALTTAGVTATALTTLAVGATALTTLAVTASTVTDSASIATALDTKADNIDVELLRTETQTALNLKADNADVETLRTEVQTALDTKSDNADLEVLRGEIEVRLDNAETKIDAILSSLKTAGLMKSA